MQIKLLVSAAAITLVAGIASSTAVVQFASLNGVPAANMEQAEALHPLVQLVQEERGKLANNTLFQASVPDERQNQITSAVVIRSARVLSVV